MNQSWLTTVCASAFIIIFTTAAQAQQAPAQTQRTSPQTWQASPQPRQALLQTQQAPSQVQQTPAKADRPDYWSIDINAAQFSIAEVHYTDENTRQLSIPRFTWMLNLAAHYNFDINENFGFYTGAAITNLGVIIKTNGIKYKRRIYTLGIPLAFKLGSLKYANFFAGIQIDRALQYQEKHKVGDSVISKFGEWWSDRTPHVLCSWFIGGQLLHTCYFKIESYFTNFFNQDYVDGTGAKPYSNMIARPFLLTFGFNIITNKKYTFMTHPRP
jgi:hypothetical protein